MASSAPLLSQNRELCDADPAMLPPHVSVYKLSLRKRLQAHPANMGLAIAASQMIAAERLLYHNPTSGAVLYAKFVFGSLQCLGAAGNEVAVLSTSLTVVRGVARRAYDLEA